MTSIKLGKRRTKSNRGVVAEKREEGEGKSKLQAIQQEEESEEEREEERTTKNI